MIGLLGLLGEVIRLELHERIRYLRREVLHMTMDEFGEKICVSRDVINNMERNRLAHLEQKRYLIRLMSLVFDVREEWLLTGDEPMQWPPPAFTFDRHLKEHHATDFEQALVKAYFNISEEARREVTENLYAAIADTHDARWCPEDEEEQPEQAQQEDE